jgi:anti-anti-sigma factor
MEIKISLTERYVIMEMIGQFWEHKDFVSYEDTVAQFVKSGRTMLVADFSRISFISSQALGRLVRTYSKTKEDGKSFVLLNPTGSVKETLDIAGFNEFLAIFNSKEDLDAFSA